MFSLKRNPRLQLILVLSIFYVLTLGHIPFSTALFMLVVCLGGTVAIDVALSAIRTRSVVPPYSAIITGLILSMIADTTAPWYVLLFIGLVAVLQKQLLRIGGRHVCNPAAFGLVMGWLVFGTYPSWWAASLYSNDLLAWNNLLLYAGLAGIVWVSGYKYKRYGTIASFLLIFGVLFALVVGVSSMSSLFLTLVSPGMLFYAFLMLPEPMTSPVLRERQLVYGAMVAAFNVGLTYLSVKTGVLLPDSSLLALLAGNALFFKFR